MAKMVILLILSWVVAVGFSAPKRSDLEPGYKTTRFSSVGWCYHLPACNEWSWSTLPHSFCNGNKQSPINILTADVQLSPDLTDFTLKGFNDASALVKIENTGTEVKVTLDEKKMAVEGGALPGLYTSRQFHLHWGNGSFNPGSEHTVDGKRYPMELHIVNVKAEYRSVTDALQDPTGLAVLGFFIETDDDIGEPESWNMLTFYLSLIENAGDEVLLTVPVSMNSLLAGVNMSKYYRYSGSLTTPSCAEAVIWTVFKEPIRVSPDLIDRFSTRVYFNTSVDSPLMTNNYRHTQPLNDRQVTSQSLDLVNKLSCVSDEDKK